MRPRVLLGALVGAYALLCAGLFFAQRSLLFPAPTERAGVPRGFEEVQVPGGTFFIWSRAEGDGPVVVHFHGNGEQVGHLGWIGAEFKQRGVSFVAVEYPGYPGADGSPSEASLLAAAEAALNELVARGVSRERFVLEGQSVGTGVAVQMAAKGWGSKLVLLSPYTSLPDVAARAFSWVPVRLLMRDRFDSASRAPGVKVPVLVIHGTDDEVIPFALGKELAGQFSSAKFIEIPGAHHNDLWEQPQTATVFDFVRVP